MIFFRCGGRTLRLQNYLHSARANVHYLFLSGLFDKNDLSEFLWLSWPGDQNVGRWIGRRFKKFMQKDLEAS